MVKLTTKLTMNKLHLSLFLIIGLFAACTSDEEVGKGTLDLNFKATYQGTPLVMFDQVYTYPDGSPIKFQLFNYYVSDITLLQEGQSAGDGQVISEVARIDYRGVYDLPTADAGINLRFDNVKAGVYTKIRIGLGLTPELNATQPGDYAADHPLSENYWSWARGYVFAKIEANADLDGDGQFSDKLTYHIGATDLYTTIELADPVVVQKDNPATITFSVDVHDILQNQQGDYLDISQPANTQDHTNNEAIYGFLWTNFTQAFGLKK